jgi:hypothetical protein
MVAPIAPANEAESFEVWGATEMRPRGARSRLRGLVASVMGVALVAACSGYQPSPSARGDSPTETRLFALYGTITGNAQELQASQYLGQWYRQLAIAHCLHETEKTYAWTSFTDSWRGWAPRGGTSSTNWLAPLGYDWLLADAHRQVAATTYTPKVPASVAKAARSTGRRQRQQRCASLVPAEDDRPTGGEFHTLHVAYYAMLHSVDAQLDRYGPAYQSCMAKAGFKIAGYQDLIARIKVEPHQPDGSTFRTSGLAADAVCRKPAHDAGMRMLAPMITAYEHQYRGELTDLHALWEDAIPRANSKSESPGFGEPHPRTED